MGFCSKQWINKGWRYRRNTPEPVEIEFQEPDNSWSRNEKLKLEVRARRRNLEFQSMYLTQEEVDEAGEFVIAAMSSQARERLLSPLIPSRAVADATGEAVVKAMSAGARERMLVATLQRSASLGGRGSSAGARYRECGWPFGLRPRLGGSGLDSDRRRPFLGRAPSTFSRSAGATSYSSASCSNFMTVGFRLPASSSHKYR
jgi:hypothetical protein